MNRAAAFVVLLLLAACGKQGDLTPVPPRTAPMLPAETMAARTAADMLVLPPQAAPVRVDDPVANSQPLPADRFNLPPTL